MRAKCGDASSALRGFARARTGATAVEFGLLALPFLGLVCATLEAGITYFGQEILQQALIDAGRQIYTGQFQTANVATTDMTALIGKFRTALCFPAGRQLITTFPCANVRISITKAVGFDSVAPVQPTIPNPVTGAIEWNPLFPAYSCARANDVMVVQAAVDVPIFFPVMGSPYPILSNNRRVLQAATVFQVEPFDSTGACPLGS